MYVSGHAGSSSVLEILQIYIANIFWRSLVQYTSKTISKWIYNYYWKTQICFRNLFYCFDQYWFIYQLPKKDLYGCNCSLSLSLSCFLDRYLLSLNLKANGNIIRGCDGWDNRRITSSSHRQRWRMNPERRGSVMDRWSEQGINKRFANYYFFLHSIKTTRWSVAELNIKYKNTVFLTPEPDVYYTGKCIMWL